MFNRVLVGVDGRAGGRDAIVLAQQLVASPSRLVLGNIYGTGALGGGGSVGLEAEHARHLLACVRQDHDLNCRTMVRRDSAPGRGLHRLAQHERADLLVVGSSHRGGLGRVVIGDDTLATLNGAPCAVAIAPRGYVFARPAWRAIGVGDDGSPESALAVAAAQDLADLHHVEVRVLSVNAHGDVVFGDPAPELTRLGHTVDLLVVGSGRQGPLRRCVNGSVAGYLARHSACPLLVVPSAVSEPAPRGSDEPSRDLRVPVGPAS